MRNMTRELRSCSEWETLKDARIQRHRGKLKCKKMQILIININLHRVVIFSYHYVKLIILKLKH